VFGNGGGPITAKLAAEMIAGETPSLDISPFKINRPELTEMMEGTW